MSDEAVEVFPEAAGSDVPLELLPQPANRDNVMARAIESESIFFIFSSSLKSNQTAEAVRKKRFANEKAMKGIFNANAFMASTADEMSALTGMIALHTDVTVRRILSDDPAYALRAKLRSLRRKTLSDEAAARPYASFTDVFRASTIVRARRP